MLTSTAEVSIVHPEIAVCLRSGKLSQQRLSFLEIGAVTPCCEPSILVRSGDITLSHEQIARLDGASAVPLGVPHTIIKENAARLAGGQLECMDVPVIPVA
jgi:hypothetical protein